MELSRLSPARGSERRRPDRTIGCLTRRAREVMRAVGAQVMHHHPLSALGWSAHFECQLTNTPPGSRPARVSAQHRGGYVLMSPDGSLAAVLAGRLQHESSVTDLPAVGDWVSYLSPSTPGPASIVHRFERTTALTRRASGRRNEAQVLAANVDRVFVVCGLDGDFNVRRLERYLALIAESGATPTVVLSKADQCEAPQARVADAAQVSGGADLLLTCAPQGRGLAELVQLLGSGQTAAFVGSSGAGKSTLINALLGTEVQRTSPVRERDGRGQHATTHRELFVLPGGALLVDTPGLRELGLWSDQDAPPGFDDIGMLAAECRFRDCTHGNEPGCAVQAAVRDGTLDPGRLESLHKLSQELDRRRQLVRDGGNVKRRWREVSLEIRRLERDE